MRREKVVLLWVLQHLLNLLHFVERVIHTFSCLVLVLDTSAHSSYPRFNFFSSCARSLNISRTHFFFFFFHWITHLLEVSAEQNRCTVVHAPMAQHRLPAPLSPPPTSPLHPPLASLHFTHLWGQLCAPLSSQRSHTHSAKPHSSLSAPASLMFLTVPQCPSVLPACNALGSCESRSLSSFSSPFLSAPHFGDTHIIYFMTEDSI